VAEIDPGVTEAAMQAFGLPRDTAINIFAMDARNYVEQLCTGNRITKYDFIYEDALNDYSIPYQLTTKEFNDKISRILTDTGVYMIELIDMYDTGLFLGAYVNTLQQTFPHVYVITEHLLRSKRNTFVILGAKHQIDLTDLPNQQPVRDLDLWVLTASEIEKVKEKAPGVVLTDNFAPVENMLAPVVRRGAVNFLSAKYSEYAQELKYEGKLDRSIKKWQQALKIDPAVSITAYTEIAAISIQQGKFSQAMHALQQALEYTEHAQLNTNMASVHLDLALVLKVLQQSAKAREHFRKAVHGFREELTGDPKNFDTLFKLGTALAELKQFDQATEYLQRAVDIKPAELECQLMLAKTLLAQQRNDEAAAALKKAIAAISNTTNKDAVAQLKRYLQLIQNKNNK
jgi:tetratricopeptide (TPR) repeat protein